MNSLLKFVSTSYRRVLLRRLLCSTTKKVPKEKLRAAAYNPTLVQSDKYKQWHKEGLFKADNSSDAPSFSMILPPPNVTGKLHLGHALACTIQDVIVRLQRSTGHNVLWLPGTDHAGIATQSAVEKYLKSTRNVDRHKLGRENFNEEIWKWTKQHSDTISQQLCTLGCSLDWSREVFTMSPVHRGAVESAFQRLFDRNLIYRKHALVNWCNALKSTISDIEVNNIEVNGPTSINIPGYDQPVKFGQLYTFAYKVFGASEEELVVSTTMPETMLGDTAVAVHPEDRRYKHFWGKRVWNPFTNKSLPIIIDDYVDMNFGTGALKITPAHSKVDFEIAKDHNIESKQVIDENGNMINSGEFDGLKRYECREKIVERLTDMGLMKHVRPHNMVLPICSRTGDVIDHLPKEQWFLSCRSMNEKAADVVKTGQLVIQPEKFVDNWLEWCEDDRDWCISRQLWWGHQVPAYKCYTHDNDLIWIAAHDEADARERSSRFLRTFPDSVIVSRDEDVLDTWFSSAIYPFAALGWPDQHIEKDFRRFYPLNLMVTGHDILGFWVHRMVILGLELTERLPFSKVLLHGIVCDKNGAKMSKSKGNIIDPVDVINGISLKDLNQNTIEMKKKGLLSQEELEKTLLYQKKSFAATNGIPECGVDALRFTLLSQDIKSHFVNFDVNQCYANKLFCNKIWQSVNYLHLCFDKLRDFDTTITSSDLTYFDKWILSRLYDMLSTVNRALENGDFHLATKGLKTFLYNELCDVYLEATKPGFIHENQKVAFAHCHTLSAALNTGLRSLSPIMVYLADEVIPRIPNFEKNIIYNYSDKDKRYFEVPLAANFEKWYNHPMEKKVEKILNTASLVRELKGLCGMPSKLRPMVCVRTADGDLKDDLQNYKPVVLNLARCKDLTFNDVETETKRYIKGFIDYDTLIGVEILGDINTTVKTARERLLTRIKKLEETLERTESKITDQRYINSTAEYARNIERQKLLAKKEELQRMQTNLGRLSYENISLKDKA